MKFWCECKVDPLNIVSDNVTVLAISLLTSFRQVRQNSFSIAEFLVINESNGQNAIFRVK